eukprot:6766134-Pyramimonas_sp.AAC.1
MRYLLTLIELSPLLYSDASYALAASAAALASKDAGATYSFVFFPCSRSPVACSDGASSWSAGAFFGGAPGAR